LKTEILNKFWNDYKANFGSENFIKTEEYKWGLFKDMYSIWNWQKDQSNQEMYKQTFLVDGPKNLWQSGNFFPTAMLNWFWEKYPEETEKAMNILLDEAQDLSNRIELFISILDEKMPELAKLITEKPINQHYHGDLRAISLYLTLQYPEKYFIYKHTMFKVFSEKLELPKVKTGKSSNYEQYLLICNEIRSFIESDDQFVRLYKDFLKEGNYYLDPYFHLLVQDFILSVSISEPSYWVFQGNPKVYDFNAAIKKRLIDQWTASAHRDKMKTGDKVIFWLTGENTGCYALGEITSEAYENKEEQDEFWKQDDKTEWKIGVKVTHDLSTNPILKEMLEDTNELKDLNVGHQGTNFSATEEQFESFLDLINSRKEGVYGKIKKALDADKLEVFISLLKKFTQDNNLNENDTRISFNIRASRLRLVFVIGSRYSLCIEKKNKETILSFISQLDITKTTETPFKNNKGEVEAYWNQFNFNQQEEFERYVFDGLNAELQRNHHCNRKNYSNPEFSKEILGKSQIKYWLYAPGENANIWEEFYRNGIMGLGWDELGDLNQFNSKSEITKKLQEISNSDSSKANDATANFDIKENIAIGDVIIAKKGRNAYLGYGFVTSDYYFDQAATIYRHRRKVNWVKYGTWNTEHPIALKTLTDITNIPYKPNPSILAPQAILKLMESINLNSSAMPTNKILFGPPGTGKTFHLKENYFPQYTTQETSLSAEQHFNNVVSECSWWQVIAIALIEDGRSKVSTIADNKWVKTKAALSNSNTIRPTIWGQLQSHTVESCPFVNVKAKQQPFIFNKTEDAFWEIITEEVREHVPELYDIIASVNHFNPSPDKQIERFAFITFHQSYSYEDFIEGIKPKMANDDSDEHLVYHIEDGVFKQLCKKAEMDPENRYAIFIDEINRGNVSAIFGELITLIETDKRKGATNELVTTLPYSKKPFSVPNNIDIIGTMNTADRSVEALDIALRRRFSFVEMLPDASKLNGKEIQGINLELLLNTMNERIEVLVDRDHTIGHAFFMNTENVHDLRTAFGNKIIPLLQEYFYGNYQKMEMVIGSEFFKITEANKVKFAAKTEDFDADGKVYHILDVTNSKVISDDAFIAALSQLIQGV
jgi:predicted Mrr-cat superfamily restriction endonuclease